jgi:AcrR family transcriptional regulator
LKASAAQSKADEIIRMTGRSILDGGITAVRMATVATDAQLSTRTLYTLFKSKEELLKRTVWRLVEEQKARMETKPMPRDATPHACLYVLGERLLGTLLESQSLALFRIAIRERNLFPNLFKTLKSALYMHFQTPIQEYLSECTENRLMQLESPGLAANLFMDFICAEAFYLLCWGIADDDATYQKGSHVRIIVDLFLQGALPRYRQIR